MRSRAYREVRLVLPMEPDIEITASEKASALAEFIRMSPDKIDELRLAVLEACINAFEHSDADDRKIYVTLAVEGDERPDQVRITVRDTGVGIPSGILDGKRRKPAEGAPRKRGWGLSIIRGLMDEVEIESGANGTTVVMTKRL